MRGLRWLVAASLGAAVLAGAPVAIARLRSTAAADAALATGSLAAPTTLLASGRSTAILDWAATASGDATGYLVLRSATSGSGYAIAGTVTPVSATSTTDDPGAGTWYYVLRTYLESWTSPPSNEASVTLLGAGSTGFQACDATANAADTGGDGDGYEGSPDAACLADGSSASDANTGTDTLDTCTGTGKDRHRFWGFALGLPPSVSSIDGIELQLVAAMSNNGGTSRICAQLSWDGGSSWTVPASVPLDGTAAATYAIGMPTDTWGHGWTPAELDPSVFRVRLVDVSTQGRKTFRLDALAVQVHYTP